jgi:hypothetical protein
MSNELSGTVESRDAYQQIKAGECCEVLGCRVSSCEETGAGPVVTDIHNGAYCVYQDIDFGKEKTATGFRVKVKITDGVGWIEVRLDSPDGPKIGMCQAAARDLGLNQWGIARTGIYGVSGIHTVYLKFIRSERCQLAFEWFKFTTDQSDKGICLADQPIPDRVPYLGPLEKYFIGSGIAGAGGDTEGIWDYLIGPGYTFYGYIKSCESFIRWEEIKLVVDAVVVALPIEMRRARGTGMFYGCGVIGDLTVHLVDYTNRGEAWIARTVMVDNNSATDSHDVAVKAYIIPAGLSDTIVDSTAIVIGHGCDEPNVNKHVTITFADPSTIAVKDGSGYVLKTDHRSISPKGIAGNRFHTTLYHHMHKDEKAARQNIEAIRAKQGATEMKDAGRCIIQWTDWLSQGDPLDNLPDQKAKDALEGALVIMKMLQGDDGGIMAAARNYMDSYVRDAAGGLRGLMAAGHTEEAEKFMQWVEHKYDITGMIPCNANIGDDAAYFPGYGDEENWAAENPALYLMIAKSYYQKMKEQDRETEAMDFFRYVRNSLRYAMDIQLKHLVKVGWRLRFNGDETESGGSGIQLSDKPVISQYWSMPSLALCGAALDFFITFLTDMEEDPANYENSLSGQNLDLFQVLSQIKDAMDEWFWRAEPEKFPNGFYDWYRTQQGEWPRLRMTNYSLFPQFYGTPLNHPHRAHDSAAVIKQYFTDRGFLPIQPGGASEDFCGHDLGYLLYALTDAEDPMAGEVYRALLEGGTMGCWGTWSEAYTAAGMSYMTSKEGFGYSTSNMRPFETGINMAAILKYLKYH